MLGFEIRGLRLSGLVPRRSCSRWRCSARRRPSRSRVGVRARRRGRHPPLARPRRSSTSPRSRPSRSSAGSRSTRSSATSTRSHGDPLWFAGRRAVHVHGREHAQLRDGRRRVAGSPTASRSRLMLRSFVTALPSEFATALLTASVAFTYGHLGMASVGLAAVVLFVFLYILRTSVQAEERGEELDQAHARARVAADGPALDGAADAVDARRDDRAPLGRRRALLARRSPRCSASTSASRT